MLLRLVNASVAALLLLTPATPVQTTVGNQPRRAQRYSAEESRDIVRLHDSETETTVSIIPSAGNLTVEMRVRGQNVLRFPYESVEDYKGHEEGSIGIPFLSPWADRLDQQAFYANGKRFAFDMSLGNVRGANPIHGFLTSANQWRVMEVKADGQSAWVTSRLEFFKNPLWLKQFPFAHTVEMTHRLQAGVLEVATRIHNLSIEPMPVAIGFHPYFQLTDSTREEWSISVPARTHWILGSTKVPTGATEPTRRSKTTLPRELLGELTIANSPTRGREPARWVMLIDEASPVNFLVTEFPKILARPGPPSFLRNFGALG